MAAGLADVAAGFGLADRYLAVLDRDEWCAVAPDPATDEWCAWFLGHKSVPLRAFA